jgi:Tol biopolymer transport system component
VDNLYWLRSDGTGDAQRLTESPVPHWPKSWHPNGKFLAYEEIRRERDVWVLPLEGDEISGWKPGKATAILSGSSNESEAAFSPDGRWLAYQSNESGRTEVYVVPFPGAESKWQVSSTGGSMPRWSANGRELFYLADDRRIMVAVYSRLGETFRSEKPRVWADVTVAGFDLHPDGKRVAALKAPESMSPRRPGDLVFIDNFFDELNRLTAQ